MSAYYLLYNDATSVTGKELGEWLKEHGLDINYGQHPGEHVYRGVIRWGSTAKVTRKPQKVLNWQAAIELASDKLKSLMRMQEADIRVPDIYSLESREIVFPVMGRASKHTGGIDIVPCWQENDLEIAKARECTYLTKYIPTKREFRFHVFGDRVIKVSEKILTDPEKWQPHIRNLSTGYTFRQPQERPRRTSSYLAVAAVDVHNLQFGAVDVIEGDDGHPYVLEVNTAPGLTTDSSLEAYGNRILEEFA